MFALQNFCLHFSPHDLVLGYNFQKKNLHFPEADGWISWKFSQEEGQGPWKILAGGGIKLKKFAWHQVTFHHNLYEKKYP